MNYKTFKTERLFLRPTTVEDAAFILELLNTEKWKLYIGDRNVNSIEDAENYIKDRMLPQLETLGFSNYTVIRTIDLAKIGSCGLYNREGLEGVDIGFAFLPEYEGKGYAYEAANCLKDAAIKDFGLTQIKAITLPSNKASQKLLEKLGLTFKELIKITSDAEELMLYQLYS